MYSLRQKSSKTLLIHKSAYTFSVIKIVHVSHRKALSKSELYETATGSRNLELTAIKTEPSL